MLLVVLTIINDMNASYAQLLQGIYHSANAFEKSYRYTYLLHLGSPELSIVDKMPCLFVHAPSGIRYPRPSELQMSRAQYLYITVLPLIVNHFINS